MRLTYSVIDSTSVIADQLHRHSYFSLVAGQNSSSHAAVLLDIQIFEPC